MKDLLHINKTFDKILYSDKTVNNREFDGCVFTNCDFSNSDFSYNIFSDCSFVDCNLSMMKVNGTSLKTVAFKECKLLGIPFNECDDFLFSVSFMDCTLDYSSFANKKMHKTDFINSSLKEVSFAGTDLTKSNFQKSNLEHVIFNATKLNEVDFTTASNFIIDPENNILRKAKFSVAGIPGLLDKYDIRIV